jgi:dephospho-CoA kinase
MIKIGLTGGIGSGKTTVCKIWQKCGAYVINADDLAKQVMASNSVVKQKLVETFGEGAYHSDGSLNREHLAEQAFEKGRVDELNEIVHPHIPREVEMVMQEAEAQGYPMLIYEAILLLKGLENYQLDFIVMVLADRQKRLRWVQQRDGRPAESIINRMNIQPDFASLTGSADFIIHNDGSFSDLEQNASNLYYKILNSNEE